jgi:hypothetical protein
MLKVGLGENGTIEGKVYLQKSLTMRVGELTWTYLKGKLYMRNRDHPFGTISVYSAETFSFEEILKLNLGDVSTFPHSEVLNKNYPILAHGDSLFLILMKVVVKDKVLKEEKKKDFEDLVKKTVKEVVKDAKVKKEKRKDKEGND